jgi:hypothetical protein
MPDLDLLTDAGSIRLYTLLHTARPVLISFRDAESIDLPDWADFVKVVSSTYNGVWELPVIGAVTAPEAVLIRPDGYVAWVGHPTDPGLPHAMAKWFGSSDIALENP